MDKIHTELVALGEKLQATTEKLREKEEASYIHGGTLVVDSKRFRKEES